MRKVYNPISDFYSKNCVSKSLWGSIVDIYMQFWNKIVKITHGDSNYSYMNFILSGEK